MRNCLSWILIILLSSIFIGCKDDPTGSTEYNVQFTIHSDNQTSAVADYTNEDGIIQNDVSISLPWTYEFETTNSGTLIQVLVGTGSGQFTVKVYINNDEVYSDAGTGIVGMFSTTTIEELLAAI